MYTLFKMFAALFKMFAFKMFAALFTIENAQCTLFTFKMFAAFLYLNYTCPLFEQS